MSVFKDVMEFRRVGEQDHPDTPTVPTLTQEERDALKHHGQTIKKIQEQLKGYDSGVALAFRLICEELAETMIATSTVEQDGLVEVADGLADLNYVVNWASGTFGLNLDKYHEEVHRANMAKFPNGEVLRDEQGKVIKPEGWTPPDIQSILNNQGPISSEG